MCTPTINENPHWFVINKAHDPECLGNGMTHESMQTYLGRVGYIFRIGHGVHRFRKSHVESSHVLVNFIRGND
jgi:hypothetical protein